MMNIYHVRHTIVDHSLTVIILTTQTWISHCVHVYYMIEMFDVFCSISCASYRILDTRNLDLSLRDLLGPLKLIIESDISCSTWTSPLTMCMVHIHIHPLTLTNKTTREKLIKGKKPCGGRPQFFQGRVNLSKWTSQVRTFFLMLL